MYCFCFVNRKTSDLFVGSLVTLFRTSGNICLMFKDRVDPVKFVLDRLLADVFLKTCDLILHWLDKIDMTYSLAEKICHKVIENYWSRFTGSDQWWIFVDKILMRPPPPPLPPLQHNVLHFLAIFIKFQSSNLLVPPWEILDPQLKTTV